MYCNLQKYSRHAKFLCSRLTCLLCVKGLAICFYLGWPGCILHFRQNIIKVGSKSWLLTRSSNITLSLPSYTGSALKRDLNFCLLYFYSHQSKMQIYGWAKYILNFGFKWCKRSVNLEKKLEVSINSSKKWTKHKKKISWELLG